MPPIEISAPSQSPLFKSRMISDGQTLILGATYPIFHSYLRQSNSKVACFVHCGSKPSYNPSSKLSYDPSPSKRGSTPPFRFFKGLSKTPIPIHRSADLESVIAKYHIRKCEVHDHSLPMPELQSLIHRILATGRCQVVFPRASQPIAAFKPVIAFTATALDVGRVQCVRYFCNILRNHGWKVSIVIPVWDIEMFHDGSDQTVDVAKGPHFEWVADSAAPNPSFHVARRSAHDLRMLERRLQQRVAEYFVSGAERVYLTSDVSRAIVHSEQRADIILYDSLGCQESPFDARQPRGAHFCVFDVHTLERLHEVSLWPGLVNLLSAQHRVFMQMGDGDCGARLRRFVANPAPLFTLVIYNSYRDASLGVDRSISERVVPKEEDEGTPPRDLEPAGDSPPERRAGPNALQSGAGCEPHAYRALDAQDVDRAVERWLLKHVHRPPVLQSHFESQVDIIMAMSEASDRELYVTNNDSANREAFCRLFLASHLPPGFRVTTGEIIDSRGNKSGQLDVVIVTDLCPRMTIDATNAVIAPITADNVLSVVEVKTTMTPKALRKALAQIRPVKALMPRHSTLASSDGTVVSDPLEGKIITGIFAFNLPEGMDEEDIAEVIAEFPGVADFIVLPSAFGFFAEQTMRVCGFKIDETQVRDGYLRYSAKGMGLAVMFGLLNVLAETRRFSGSHCTLYLDGQWQRREQRQTRGQSASVEQRLFQDAELAIQKLKEIVPKGTVGGNVNPKRVHDARCDKFCDYLKQVQSTQFPSDAEGEEGMQAISRRRSYPGESGDE